MHRHGLAGRRRDVRAGDAECRSTFAIAQGGARRSRSGRWPTRRSATPTSPSSATASSGLAVSFAAAGNCTVSGSTVHLTARARARSRRRRAATRTTTPRASVPQTFTINPGQPTRDAPDALEHEWRVDLDFLPGSWVNGGFHVKLTQSNASPVTVQVTGNVLLPVHCSDAGGAPVDGTISVPVSKTFTIPAGSTSWYADERPEEHPRLDGRRAGAGGVRRERRDAQHRRRDASTRTSSPARTAGGSASSSTTACRSRRASRTRTAPIAGDRNHTTACQAKWSGTASI